MSPRMSSGSENENTLMRDSRRPCAAAACTALSAAALLAHCQSAMRLYTCAVVIQPHWLFCVCAAAGLRRVMGGYDMDRVGSLADWAAASGERSFPGFAEVKG